MKKLFKKYFQGNGIDDTLTKLYRSFLALFLISLVVCGLTMPFDFSAPSILFALSLAGFLLSLFAILVRKIYLKIVSKIKKDHKIENVNQINDCKKESISTEKLDNSGDSDSADKSNDLKNSEAINTSNNQKTKMTDNEGDNYIINIPKLWMLINKDVPKNQPVIGRDNMCYLFSDLNEATKVVTSSNGDFDLYEISGKDFMFVEMQKLVMLGIKGAKIRNTEHTLSMNFNRGICNYLGEKFSSLAIRYLQTMNSKLKNDKEEYLEELKKELINEINDSLFYVPCLYSDEDDSVNVNDNMLRVFPDAIRYLTTIARMNVSNDFVLIDENDNKTLLKDTGTMDFASMPTGKKLTMCKVKSGMTNKDYIAGSTTISELKMMFSNQRIGLATINDIKNLAESENGLEIILNPFSLKFTVTGEFLATKCQKEINNEICDHRYCVSDTELVIYNEIGLMLGALTNLNERKKSGDKFFYCRTKRNAEEIKAYFSKLQPHNLSDPCFPLFIVIENDTDNDALNSVKNLLDNSFKYTILKLDKSKDGIAWFAPEENTYYNTTASLVGYGMVDCAESIYEVKTSKTFIEFQYGNH